jgi:hypothetical protein
MQMRFDLKNAGQVTGYNDSSIRFSKQCLVGKYHSLIILKIVLISV